MLFKPIIQRYLAFYGIVQAVYRFAMIFVVITVIIRTFQFLVDEVILFVQSLIFDSSAFFYSSTTKGSPVIFNLS